MILPPACAMPMFRADPQNFLWLNLRTWTVGNICSTRSAVPSEELSTRITSKHRSVTCAPRADIHSRIVRLALNDVTITEISGVGSGSGSSSGHHPERAAMGKACET